QLLFPLGVCVAMPNDAQATVPEATKTARRPASTRESSTMFAVIVVTPTQRARKLPSGRMTATVVSDDVHSTLLAVPSSALSPVTQSAREQTAAPQWSTPP